MSDKKRKVLVLGIDGMDPRSTRQFLDEGIMPNTQKFLEKGAANKDLVMLGGHPTVTPPMWTTLSTGCYAGVHGITDFYKAVPGKLDRIVYNLDSRDLLAEQSWNVTAEAGYKTLVWNWPGCAWPPTSDNPNLAVVDGTSPGTPGSSMSVVDGGFLVVAGKEVKELTFQEKAATDSRAACIIEGLETEGKAEEDDGRIDLMKKAISSDPEGILNIMLDPMDGESQLTDTPYDILHSPVKDAAGWSFDIPADAKEFVLQFQQGAVRRVALVTKNEAGIYDTVTIYKNKKDSTPVVVMGTECSYPTTEDELFDRAGNKITTFRYLRVLEIEPENANRVVMYVGCACDPNNNTVWHPTSLHKELLEHVGYSPMSAMVGGADRKLIEDVMMDSWTVAGEYQYQALKYAMNEMGFEVIYSHYHNIDAYGHQIMKYLKTGHNNMPVEEYRDLWRKAYKLTDDYIGKFLHFIDEGWTILIVSDHGQVCPENGAYWGVGQPCGVNVRVLQELGYTVLKTDENGNEKREIDWEKTRAIATRANHVYINLKGRDEHGIVDPEDKYAVEEQLITDMYSYKDPVTKQGIFTMVLRNKEAELVGLSGPRCGDIIYFVREGYTVDHGDSASTTWGVFGTSVSPIFMAAGPGIKENFLTERTIREIDVTPTICTLLGTRMPAQCEGAPVYQILV